ncbi:MAG TPA: hypothetical protein PKB02_02455 [Anaerohalosphaeraceae bacterium]|nr:hypothetical protein [Anaerohalosphaeraceae bacterium]
MSEETIFNRPPKIDVGKFVFVCIDDHAMGCGQVTEARTEPDPDYPALLDHTYYRIDNWHGDDVSRHYEQDGTLWACAHECRVLV